MNNSKLVGLYKTLNSFERKRFKGYIESSFFNSNAIVTKMNRYIYEHIDEERENKLEKKTVYAQLFNTDKYHDQKMKDVMSVLMNQLETFISYQRFEKNKLLQKEFLLIELRERNLDNHFISNINEYIKKMEGKKIHDSAYFNQRYVLERELDHYFIKKEVRKTNISLQRKSDSFDTFYLSEKLKNFCEMENRKNIISANYDFNMIEEILSYIKKKKKPLQSTPSVYIYYKILLSLRESEVSSHFKELKQSLDKYAKEFSKAESREMYDYAQNYCIKKINEGNSEYEEELFSIYASLLESEIIFEDNYLSQWDYKNIVSVGLKLEKFDWTKKFIEQYKNRIAREFRENAYQYNLAIFYYTGKDYKNALKLLNAVEFTDPYYHLSTKFLLLKMYYELEDVESFYYLIGAYKVYLLRNKNISKYQREVHQNIVRYAKQAFDLKLKGPGISRTKFEMKIKNLKEKINADKKDANLSWLLEKVNEL